MPPDLRIKRIGAQDDANKCGSGGLNFKKSAALVRWDEPMALLRDAQQMSHIEIGPFCVPLWIVMLAIIRATPKIFMKWARWILIERWDKREIPEDRKEYGIFKGIPGIR